MPSGRLNLTVVDVKGGFLTEPVDLFMRNQTLSHTVALRDLDVSKPVVVTGLNPAPNGFYSMEVDAMSYHAVGRFVSIPASGAADVTVTLPIDPKKVIRVDFPAFGATKISSDAWTLLNNSKAVVDGSGALKTGQALYDSLGDIPKAGFLNLVAKADRTKFTGQVGTPRSALSYIQTVMDFQGDRFIALVDSLLRSESMKAQHDGVFNQADEILHTPPQGFNKDLSFKTQDHYGNLQLSFFSSASGQFALDMDIDDAQGFEHLFQVLGNIGSATHPYNIHEILIASQELDPGYELILRETAPKAAALTTKKAKAARVKVGNKG